MKHTTMTTDKPPIIHPSRVSWSVTSPTLTRYIWLLWVIWLIFLWFPLLSLFRAHPGRLHLALVLATAALFAATYIWHVTRSLHSQRTGSSMPAPWPALALMAAIAIGLTLGDRTDWVELFIFVTVSFGPALPPRKALIGVATFVCLAPLLALAVGAGITLAVQMMFQSAISGVAVIIVVRTIVLDRELRLAREEIARLAVSEERLRFARDLHDLLGHSLSLIALKSELVGRLIPVSPERALAENRDLESAARAALQEVRAAVAGYRQPSLADELRSADQILTAAGIEYRREGEVSGVPAGQEAILSWTVREGVTNVIKHSHAQHCTIRLTQRNGRATVEITDDGTGGDARIGEDETPGSGLRGLAERAEAAGGRCESGRLPDGGFRLAVTVPVRAEMVRSA